MTITAIYKRSDYGDLKRYEAHCTPQQYIKNNGLVAPVDRDELMGWPETHVDWYKDGCALIGIGYK